MQDWYPRYARHLSMPNVGEEGQLKLSAAKVLVVGAGALGCPVLQYLTGAGVGTIGIVDGDKVEISNLHRQTLYTTAHIGQPKAQVASEALSTLNPDVKLITETKRLTRDWIEEIFPNFDLVVDATDNYESRYLINDACVFFDKPLVSGSIYLHEGQVSVFNYENGPSYRCIFPNEESLGFGCTETGVLGPLPGMIGSIMGLEALKLILGLGEVLSGKLMLVNSLNWEIRMLEFDRSEDSIQKAITQFQTKVIHGS